MVTQKHAIKRASLVRWGIGAEFVSFRICRDVLFTTCGVQENDFIATAMGRASVLGAIGQIVRAFSETANCEVLMALLNCHRYQHEIFRQAGIASYQDLHAMLDRQAARWMCAQKGDFGLERVDRQINAELERVKGYADTWIISADVSDYVATVHEAKIYYDKGGQEAVDRINGRPSIRKTAAGNTGGVTRSIEPYGFIGQSAVYLARSYTVDPNTHLDLLSRQVEVGVFNTMIDNTSDYKNYTTKSRHIRVYDNERDDWSEITLIEAIRGCGIWDKDGRISDQALRRTGNVHDPSAVTNDPYDFLSYNSPGGRRNIEVFGDIAPAFAHAEHFINAGKTLRRAAGIDAGQYGAPGGKAYVIPRTDLAAPIKSTLAEAAEENIEMATHLRHLLGDRNRAFPKGITPESVTAFFTAGTHDLIAPTTSVGAAAGAGRGGGAPPEDMAQGFLNEVIGAGVPAAHKTRVQEIASNTGIAWTERAAQIKDLVLAHRAEDADIAKNLPKTQDVDKWYNGSIKKFKEQVAALAPAQKQQSTGAQELHLLPTGRPVPAGFTIVHSARTGKLLERMNLVGAPAGATDAGAPGGRGAGITRKEDLETNKSGISDGNYPTNIAAINDAFASADDKAWAKLYASIEVTRNRLVALAQADVAVLLGFLLMRPHATYETRYAIKCAAGGNTGYTMYGHTNMQLASEAARKVGLMHFTAYMTALVMEPKNVYVLEDIFCKKYLGGMCVRFWDAASYKQTGKRTSRSIICAPLPPSRRRLEQKIDIRGRWYTALDMGLISDEAFDQPLYEGAQRMAHLFGLRDGGRKGNASNRARVAYNTVCWTGAQWTYNPITGQFDDYTTESGHFGAYVGPGAGKLRNGEAVRFEPRNYGVHRG